MPGVSRDNDTAGGDLIPSYQNTLTTKKVYANGQLIIVHGDSVEPHGLPPHNDATMIAGSKNVFIGGKAVVNKDDFATCGHQSTGSTGDKAVNVGDP